MSQSNEILKIAAPNFIITGFMLGLLILIKLNALKYDRILPLTYSYYEKAIIIQI